MSSFENDPNPPKWPNNKVSFNRWFVKLHAFIYALQQNFSWVSNPFGWGAKYIDIRIDTRNGGFLIFAENRQGEKQRISPDELGLEFKDVFICPVKPDMLNVPKDREILIKTQGPTNKQYWDIVKYYPQSEVWVGSEGDYTIDGYGPNVEDGCTHGNIIGWWDLPNE